MRVRAERELLSSGIELSGSFTDTRTVSQNALRSYGASPAFLESYAFETDLHGARVPNFHIEKLASCGCMLIGILVQVIDLPSSKSERRVARMVKRIFDVVASAIALIVLSPVLVVVGLLISLEGFGPILFHQKRPGEKGIPFLALKFRTMVDKRDDRGILLPDEVRITRLGAFLRRSSLDELPQFWNVLRGDMSLVGPRPLLMQYLDRYTTEQARRHLMPPGITGLTQVSGRNELPWDKKLELDVWYVDHWSLWLDFRILGITAWKVLKGEGVSAEGSATMPEFMGSDAASGTERAKNF